MNYNWTTYILEAFLLVSVSILIDKKAIDVDQSFAYLFLGISVIPLIIGINKFFKRNTVQQSSNTDAQKSNGEQT